jgi:hypothetical protein
MIGFTRRCCKVRECDRRSLATTLDAIVVDDFVKALPVADRESIRRRLADVFQEVETLALIRSSIATQAASLRAIKFIDTPSIEIIDGTSAL